MHININKSHGWLLIERPVTEQYASMVPDITESRCELEFSNCVLDYPATATLVDAYISKLCLNPGPRELIVIYDTPFHERILLKWFFFESRYLSLEEHSATEAAMREHVSARFALMELRLSIVIHDLENKTVRHTFTYDK